MHRLVANCFKAIIYSMLFIFVWNFAFYLYKVTTLNQRVENIVSSMQRVVMENNYMPADMNGVYFSMFAEIYNSFNGFDGTSSGITQADINSYISSGTTATVSGVDVQDLFVVHVDWNYDNEAVDTISNLTVRDTIVGGGATRGILHKKMCNPANYGDVMAVQVRVVVQQPMFTFTGGSAENFKLDSWSRTTLTYTYYVPCLKYQQIN